jgi:hypothetical protein
LRPEKATLAQLVEQLIRNEQVEGSSPFSGSKYLHQSPNSPLSGQGSQGVQPPTIPLGILPQALAAWINVRKYDWVIDMDIKGFFDNIDHELILKALDKVVEEKWVKMYCKRWLEVPVQKTCKQG